MHVIRASPGLGPAFGLVDESVFTSLPVHGGKQYYASFNALAAFSGTDSVTPVDFYGSNDSQYYAGTATPGSGSRITGRASTVTFNGTGTLDFAYANRAFVASPTAIMATTRGYQAQLQISGTGSVTNYAAFEDLPDSGGSAATGHGFYQTATNHPNLFNSRTTFGELAVLAKYTVATLPSTLSRSQPVQ